MARYRKRPLEVSAYQIDTEYSVHTLEGTMHASPGDYIITGIHGEQYPCKPDIFEASYEKVEQQPPTRRGALAKTRAAVLRALRDQDNFFSLTDILTEEELLHYGVIPVVPDICELVAGDDGVATLTSVLDLLHEYLYDSDRYLSLVDYTLSTGIRNITKPTDEYETYEHTGLRKISLMAIFDGK